jgi:hypothetical protein
MMRVGSRDGNARSAHSACVMNGLGGGWYGPSICGDDCIGDPERAAAEGEDDCAFVCDSDASSDGACDGRASSDVDKGLRS